MMNKAIQQIHTLEDLRYVKKRLRKKLEKQENNIEERFHEIKGNISPANLIGNLFSGEALKMEWISTLIPIAFNLKSVFFNRNTSDNMKKGTKKKVAIAIVAGATIGLGIYWLLKQRKKKEEAKQVLDPDKEYASNEEYSFV